MPTIDIYPECPKPEWMRVGVKCRCLGEAFDVFTVAAVGEKAAVLESHGVESFTKLREATSDLTVQGLRARRRSLLRDYNSSRLYNMTQDFRSQLHQRAFDLLHDECPEARQQDREHVEQTCWLIINSIEHFEEHNG